METTFTASLYPLAAQLFVLAIPLALYGCAATPQPQSVAAVVVCPATELITPQLIATQQDKGEAVFSNDISRLLVRRAPSYTIDSGDILSIVVRDHPELVGVTAKTASGAVELTAAGAPVFGFMVDPRGQLQFPFAGTLKVAGMTEEQARRVLEKKLTRYIVTPKVALRVHGYRSKRVFVDGAVSAPGVQEINDIPMTLMEALRRAGGLLPTADQSRVVLERGKQRYGIDMRELVQKHIDPNTLMLASGDILRVHDRDDDVVVVSGEVVSPRALAMRDGRLTLNEALGEAGGLSPQPNAARQVYVVRKMKDGVRLFQLDIRDAGATTMAQDFELRPKDVVHVAAAPPSNWKRKLAPLKPTALSASLGDNTGKP